MAFFDEIKERATVAASIAGRAAGDAYEATKIKLAIAEKKGTLRAIYREIGEMVYKCAKNDGEVSNEAVEDKIMEIDAIMEEITALNERQMKIKKVRSCPSCGSEIPMDCNFCPKCGKEAAAEEAPAEAEIVEEEKEKPAE